jgi:N-acetylglucosamine kinase-like BadF-type ATPase
MKIIAESSSTRTEWALVDDGKIVEHAFTTGLNPYFQSRREISHSIRLELPDAFFRRRWEHVYFYGAGCANKEKIKIMESSLVAQFKTPVTVNSDLLGAARGLLVRKPGLACILGTGSNSCQYDGHEIVKNVKPLGYVLGDEGSNAYMGKHLIADILRELAPAEISRDFYEKFQLTPNVLMDAVYSNPLANRSLAKYAFFLKDHLDNEYAYDLVYNSLMQFFVRNVSAYDYESQPLNFVGSTCVMYEDILRRVAKDFGAQVDKTIKYSMSGLVEYHSTADASDDVSAVSED